MRSRATGTVNNYQRLSFLAWVAFQYVVVVGAPPRTGHTPRLLPDMRSETGNRRYIHAQERGDQGAASVA